MSEIKENDLVKFKYPEGDQKKVYLVGQITGDFMQIRQVRKDGSDHRGRGTDLWFSALRNNFMKVGERVQ